MYYRDWPKLMNDTNKTNHIVAAPSFHLGLVYRGLLLNCEVNNLTMENQFRFVFNFFLQVIALLAFQTCLSDFLQFSLPSQVNQIRLQLNKDPDCN